MRIFALSFMLLSAALSAGAQTIGPYNAEFTSAGDSLKKELNPSAITGPAVTLSAWVKPSEAADGPIAVVGNADGWTLSTIDGKLTFAAPGVELTGKALTAGQWTLITVTSDGQTVKLYQSGRKAADKKAALQVPPTDSLLMAPRGEGMAFAGRIAGLRIDDGAAGEDAIKARAATLPQDDLIAFEDGSPTWPIQVRQMYGQQAPQDAWTLPVAKGGYTQPVAKPAYDGPAVVADSDASSVIKAWRLMPAPQVSAKPETISAPGFDASAWYIATTPGTVLTTLVERGVYADPAYGLNNLTIPETLNKQDYWYRTEFPLPADYKPGRHLFVTFKGVNYAADVWVNGHRLGDMKGAFIRGDFDLAPYVRNGSNAIAVRVSPPPHPGIAQEESLSAGPGDNGGQMVQDGPTFMATEGWDWIPSVRDRNTGIWQDVTLTSTGDARLGDVQIITALPKADNSEANLTINLPMHNFTDKAIRVRIEATITAKDGSITPVDVTRDTILQPGDSTVRFPPVVMQNPQLWWPNGYGKPNLHVLSLKVYKDGFLSDQSQTRFGIRQVTYELSLVDTTGHLQRVEANFTRARELGVRITDGRHQAIHKLADLYGTQWGCWATGLRPEAQGTAAITPIKDTSLTPYLVIKVNGVRIAARGGNWGMDDFMKRIGRDRLEPYFRLHRDAHINIIRNWVGQNTEDAFYDLADEYGLMVMNDFWASTQNYNLEPADVPLFMANAKDVVDRYRNHPSIVLWFGRNEGMPQPVLNEALEDMVNAEDGTRWYSGSSNKVNLQDSGPYSYKAPADYFTQYARGFSVESGTPSFPTLESWQAAMPQADQWPISDTWAYHDWHAQGNGATKPFEDALAARYGAPESLADFDRKAQMMNLDSHRAIFEGMNAGLWTRHSGRLLWMTQPAWPSSMWQILSHDYDTQASFYGVMSAAEPVHVQMNLPSRKVIVVNNPNAPLDGATVTAEAYAIDGTQLAKASQPLSVAGVAISPELDFGIEGLVAEHKAAVVKLSLTDADGTELSRNVYWEGATDEDLQALNGLPETDIDLLAMRTGDGLMVTLTNTSAVPVLENKLTLVDDQGQRILPAYYSDNYVSLMPGESRTVSIDFVQDGAVGLNLRGWNTAPKSVTVP